MDERTAEPQVEPDDSVEPAQLRSRRSPASELREQAAAIAVDMEQGLWVDPDSRERWPVGRPVSKTAVARAMGYRVANRSTLSFMAEPQWSRALQFERLRREATSSADAGKVRQLVTLIANGLLLEAYRRVLLVPETIADRVLIVEARQYVEMGASLSGGEPAHAREDQYAALSATLRRLPPSARVQFLHRYEAAMARGAAAQTSALERFLGQFDRRTGEERGSLSAPQASPEAGSELTPGLSTRPLFAQAAPNAAWPTDVD